MKILRTIVNIILFINIIPLPLQAQPKISLTAAINYVDLQTSNPDDFGYSYEYLLPLEMEEKFMPAVGLKIEQAINSRFYADYQLRSSFGWFDIGRNPNPFIILEMELANVKRIFTSTQTLSFSMKLSQNFDAGIGGFLKLFGTKPFYFFNNPSRHTGFLLKTSYEFKKWQVELRYLKGIGEVQDNSAPGFIAMDTVELSLSYMLFQIKSKKKSKSLDD